MYLTIVCNATYVYMHHKELLATVALFISIMKLGFQH